jgi:hypothetical protein
MLDPRLRGLFTRCFVNGHRDPKARPPADEWRAALVDAAAALVPCPRNASHFHWPHAKPCPWCERAAKLGGRDPFPALAQVRTGTHLKPLTKGPPPVSRPQPQVQPRPQPTRQVQPQSRAAQQVPIWQQPAPQMQPQSRAAPQVQPWQLPAPQVQHRPQFTWLSRPGRNPVPQPLAPPESALMHWLALAGVVALIGVMLWLISNL